MAPWSCAHLKESFQKSNTHTSHPEINTSVCISTDAQNIWLYCTSAAVIHFHQTLILSSVSFLPMVKLKPSMLKVALLPLVKPFFLESVSDMFSFSRVVLSRVNPKVVRESFVSGSSDLSILTCSHTVLSEERHYFSFSIILVLCHSHCLIIFSPAECESPLNRALSV